MRKLIIITNHYEHAKRLIIDEHRLPLNQIVIVTPDSTDKLRGFKDIPYLAMRPLYARELEYVHSHDLKEIQEDDLSKIEWYSPSRITLAQMHTKLTTEFAHKLADYEDSAAFAYMDSMMSVLKEKGEDPTQYELAFIESEYPETVEIEDGLKMVVRKRLQLRKIA